MPALILVRHSVPQIVPGLPASRWRLSDEGRLRCHTLAARLAEHSPSRLVASTEPKARETAQIVAEQLNKPFAVAEGLHEHDRSNIGLLEAEAFQAAVAAFFSHPGELMMGKETADEAHQRFSRAIAGVMERYPNEDVAVVTHGTVLTLFVTRAAGWEPFPFWKCLGLPAFVVLSYPELKVVKMFEQVDH